METTRQQKISRLLQKELSTIFLGVAHNFQGILISTTKVHVSPDLSVARVYLSIFPSERGEEMLQLINEKSVSIRHDLAGRTRFQLRTVPELTFYIDDSLDYMEHIDNLLK